MHVPSAITRALGWAAFEFSVMQPFIPMYLHLLASAILPIYAGAHASLSRPSSAAKQSKHEKQDGQDIEPEDEETSSRMENLSATDAILFPFLAGAMLTGLYFLIKWLEDPALLNKILNWYFAGFSIFSVSRMVSDALDVVHSIAFPTVHIDNGVLYRVNGLTRTAKSEVVSADLRTSPLPSFFSRIPLPKPVHRLLWFLQRVPNRRLTIKAAIRELFQVEFRLGIHGVEGFVIGLSAVAWYNFVSKPWWLTNLMGFGFAYGTLQILSPTTFWTGSLVLGGLFFYDIYFVFFTPMMVTVAKSLDVPIKLLFPRPADPNTEPALQALSMLGLGDIVLPGIMIGLALRFDLYLFYLRKQVVPKRRKSSKMSTPVRDQSAEGAENDAASHSSSHPSDDIIKAPYISVGDAWGDRLWTSSPLTGIFQSHGYVARNAFPKPYFHASLTGYFVGMLTTLGAMQISNHAQPALLYLVPGVLTSLWGTAFFRGEIKEMWTFSDAEDEGSVPETSDGKAKGSSDKTGTPHANGGTKKDAPAKRNSAELVQEVGGTKDMKASQETKSGRTLISFSIMLPAPLPPSPATSSSGGTPSRYSLRSQETKGDEPAGKRRRIV